MFKKKQTPVRNRIEAKPTPGGIRAQEQMRNNILARAERDLANFHDAVSRAIETAPRTAKIEVLSPAKPLGRMVARATFGRLGAVDAFTTSEYRSGRNNHATTQTKLEVSEEIGGWVLNFDPNRNKQNPYEGSIIVSEDGRTWIDGIVPPSTNFNSVGVSGDHGIERTIEHIATTMPPGKYAQQKHVQSLLIATSELDDLIP